MNQSSSSGNSSGSEPYEEFYNWAQTITGLVLYPLVCLVGIPGNVLSLVVLTRKDMVNSTNTFLFAMTLSDLLKLLNDLMYVVVTVSFKLNSEHADQLFTTLYPACHFVLQLTTLVTAWLTVAVAICRYIMICYPDHARKMCTVQRARGISVTLWICLTILTIPAAFRYRQTTTNANETSSNATTTTTTLDPQILFNNETATSVYIIAFSVIRSLLPFCVLCYFNVRLIYSLQQIRAKLNLRQSSVQQAQYRISVMLVAIIATFSVCVIPDTILTLLQFGYVDSNYLVRGIRECTDLLLPVHAASNFFLYCVFNQMFRSTLKLACCSRCSSAPLPAKMLPNSISVRTATATGPKMNQQKSDDSQDQIQVRPLMNGSKHSQSALKHSDDRPNPPHGVDIPDARVNEKQFRRIDWL